MWQIPWCILSRFFVCTFQFLFLSGGQTGLGKGSVTPSHTKDNRAIRKAGHQRERASETSPSAGLTFATLILT